MTTASISLNSLKVSPHNVRKSHDKGSLEELKASILNHGLLQPPLVTKADDGVYYVVDGARRLAALHGLQKDGALPADHRVPCQVAGDGDASELSLAANVIRDAMHPADEFEAFVKLSEKGLKIFDIAKRFGKTEKHVLQRMKLGRVAPEILKDYRAGKLNLEAVMAFTLTDDLNSQRKVYKGVKDHPHHHVIRRLLTESKISSRSKLATFVGLAAYEKSGGKISADLFGEEIFLEDAALLQRLANNKLAAKAEKLKTEGWGWIEVALERDYSFVNGCDEIEAKPTDAPKKLLDKQAKLKAEFEKIDAEWDIANQSDEDDDGEVLQKIEAMRDKAQELIDEVEAEFEEYNAYDPEEMKTAGCYVNIGHDCKIMVEKGLVKPEGKKTAKGQDGDSRTPVPKPKEKGFSQSIIDSIKQQRLQIAQAALAEDPDTAFDLLVFKAACDKFTNSYIHTGPEVSFSRNHFRSDMVPDTKNTVAGKALLAAREKLNLAWQKEKTEPAMFEVFCQMSHPAKLEILAYCIAGTLQPQLAQKNAFETAIGYTEVDVADYWRPTADNYLSRVTRDQLLDIGREVFSKAWAEKWASSKKGDLVKELDRAFADPKKFSGNKETEDKLRTWLPEGMAFTLPEKKSVKAKKKAA